MKTDQKLRGYVIESLIEYGHNYCGDDIKKSRHKGFPIFKDIMQIF